MQITSIKESGTNSTLLWAINNGGNPKFDDQLTAIVNDELFYLVTISDVNFLELYKLTQMYREKLRIISEYQAAIPNRKSLITSFNGNFQPKEDDPETQAPLYQIIEPALDGFMNLVAQMESDDDIISPSARRLFIPMLCRKFDVQIPVGFYDFVTSMSEDEATQLFTSEYPGNIQSQIVDAEYHGVKTILSVAFVKATTFGNINTRYTQYVKMIKYAPLKKVESTKLYKFGLLGFHKYDNITRGEVRVTFSPIAPAKDNLVNSLRRLGQLSTPLFIDFAVSIPIQYMQMIMNTYTREELNIQYESPMSVIIDGGLTFDDFITPNINPDTEDPNEIEELEKFNNEVSAYKQRLHDANQLMMKVMAILLENEGDIDTTGAFALTPSIYNVKAVISINPAKANEYANFHDLVIREMFENMLGMASHITADINKVKNS